MHYVNIYLNIIGGRISNKKAIYTFKRINIPDIKGHIYFDIYYAFKNDESDAYDGFISLTDDEQDEVKSLIRKIVTVDNYKSPKIRWNLRGYNYGELLPKPHRFFFFRIIGNNLVFFGYTQKDQNSLGDKFYKDLNKKKKEYEKEFKRQASTLRRHI